MSQKEMFLKAVACELKVIRIEHGDSQEELSRKNGVAPSTISKYETNQCNMALDKIEQIISPYNISLSIFFDRILAKTQTK